MQFQKSGKKRLLRYILCVLAIFHDALCNAEDLAVMTPYEFAKCIGVAGKRGFYEFEVAALSRQGIWHYVGHAISPNLIVPPGLLPVNVNKLRENLKQA